MTTSTDSIIRSTSNDSTRSIHPSDQTSNSSWMGRRVSQLRELATDVNENPTKYLKYGLIGCAATAVVIILISPFALMLAGIIVACLHIPLATPIGASLIGASLLIMALMCVGAKVLSGGPGVCNF